MHNRIIRSAVITLFIALVSLGTASARAAEKGDAIEATQKSKRSDRAPFQGKIHAVDKAAQTVTLEGKERKRIIHLTAQTRIAKAGQPASLEDAAVGEEVAGQTIRTSDGREEAVSLRLGPKPKEAARPNTGRKAKATETN